MALPPRTLVPAALLLLVLGAVSAEQEPGAATVRLLHWRGLLQAPDGSQGGPKTAVISNINTQGQPVYCINVTRPFQEAQHGASGTERPTGADVDELAALICSDYQAAGLEIFSMVRAGADAAKQAAQALKQATCPDANALPNAVTVATIQAQETLGSVADVRAFFHAWVAALQAVGVPACVTLVESDAAGQRVSGESYFSTS